MIAFAAYLALAPALTAPLPVAPPSPQVLVPAAAPVLVSPAMAAPAYVAAPPVDAAPAPSAAEPATTGTPPAATEVVGAVPRIPGDPHERFNRGMFARYQKLDRAVLRPAAMGYKRAVPRPMRSGIRHFFSNLTEPIVFLNFLLQGKPGKAMETLGRFVINSTVGIGGLVDVAKSPGVNLPHRPNGFADTLGFYGVKPGAYLFLPLVGPTTVRDLIGGQLIDGAVLPLAVGRPFTRLYFQLPRAVLTGLDERAQSEGDLQALLAGAVDPYATLRSVYLQDRAAEIAALHGTPRAGRQPVPANDNLDDPLVDPAAKATPVPSAVLELQDPLADPAASAPASR